MGENTSGWCRISVSGEPGSLVEIRYGERLYSDGRVDQEHIGKFMETGFFQTDRYLLEGNGTEVWEPQFVYHGFQYVQVEVLHGSAQLHQITGRVVHTAFSKNRQFSLLPSGAQSDSANVGAVSSYQLSCVSE